MHFASLKKNGELERALLFFITAIITWHRSLGFAVSTILRQGASCHNADAQICYRNRTRVHESKVSISSATRRDGLRRRSPADDLLPLRTAILPGLDPRSLPVGRAGVNLLGISDAAERIGFRSLAVRLSFKRLRDEAPLPCIAHWEGDHFIVVYEITRNKVRVADPAAGMIDYSHEEFLRGQFSAGFRADGKQHRHFPAGRNHAGISGAKFPARRRRSRHNAGYILLQLPSPASATSLPSAHRHGCRSFAGIGRAVPFAGNR